MKPNTTVISIKSFFLGLLFLFSLQIIVRPQATTSSSQVSPELVKQLTSIAEEAILAQNEILVSGDVINSLKTKVSKQHYQTAMKKQFDNQIERRNLLKKKQQDYKSFQTKFVLDDVWSDGSKITLIITELTKLKLEVLGGPPFTQYSQDYVFEFSEADSQWSVSKVSEVPIGFPTPTRNSKTPKPSNNQPLAHSLYPPELPTTDAPPGYRPITFLRSTPNNTQSPMFLKTSYFLSEATMLARQ